MTSKRRICTLLTALAACGLLIPLASGQTAKRKVRTDTRSRGGSQSKVIRVDPVKTKRTTSRVTYLPTGPSYRHIRVVERPLRGKRLADSRTVIVRSTSVQPRCIVSFDDRRQTQVRSVIRLYREGNRAQAVRTWGGFVASLVDYHDPVDLDEIMLYVSRESCFHDDDAVLFHTQKLAFLRDSADRLDYYIHELENRRAGLLNRGRYSTDALEDIESELVRARAERDIVSIRMRSADKAYETGVLGSHNYEDRFGRVFGELYSEAGTRIRVTTGPKKKYLRP